LTKGRIADLSSIAAANESIKSWHHGSLNSHESAPQKASQSASLFWHRSTEWTTHRQTQRACYVWQTAVYKQWGLMKC